LAATQTDQDADKQYLSDVEVECTEKAHSYKEKQQLSGDELEALAEAISILGSGDVTGAGEKYLPGLAQTG
jgi:hypothetical protein